MADKLQSVIQIDGKDYEVAAKTAEVAETAKTADAAKTAEIATKVQGTLTIKVFEDNGVSTDYTFDGSESVSIDVTRGGAGGQADEIQVHMDNGVTSLATISIRSVDPEASEGGIGDIWFKYSN